MMRYNREKIEKKLLRCLWTLAAVFAMLLSLTVPLAHAEESAREQTQETAPEEMPQQETVPGETVPEETVAEETVPEETVPEETIPEETIPEETIPEETPAVEQFRVTFFYSDRTESVSIDAESSFAQMYPGIDPDTLVAEKENHTFLGWYAGTDGGQTLEAEPFDFWSPITADVELYPLFRLNAYTVTFVLEGETLGSVTVEHGADAQLPEIPVREGYAGAWDHDGKAITADTVITLHYTREGSGMFFAVASEDNFGGGWLSESGESLAEAVPLTEQERLLLEEGTDVSVRLALKRMDAGVSAGDRALAEGILGDMKLCMYLEASLFKQVGQEPETALEELSSGITVSFVLPQSLLPEDGTVRAFSVIRVHNGVAEAVEAVYNRETGVLSFTSDCFSVFAVACTDAATPPPALTPSTGDRFLPGAWCLTMAVCGLALVGLWQRKKKIM